MTKITLTDLVNLQNEATAVSAINNNNAVVETAFDNTLSRDGTAPNTMSAPLDMNSNQVINVGAPLSLNSAVRLTDLNTLNGGGTIVALPPGGTTNQVLTKSSNLDYAVNWGNTAATVSSVGLSMPADFIVTNSPVTTAGTLTANWTTFPTGVGAVVRATSPTLVTPILGNATATTINGGFAITSASTNAVTNTMMSNMASNTVKANITGGATSPADVALGSLYAIPQIYVQTTGSGTFTTPAGAKYLEVELIGGGGGSSGSGTTAGNGGAGGNTTFGSSFLTGTGGSAGTTSAGTPAAGGVPTGGDVNITGGAGGSANVNSNTYGGDGGDGFYGGGGGIIMGNAGRAGVSGGGASGAGSSATAVSGGGGGAGGYCFKLITSPLSTYAWAIGAAGTAGAAGTGGFVGAVGGAGLLIVRTYFT